MREPSFAEQPIYESIGTNFRPAVVGGWDLAAGRPKPTRRAVPAGSVYFFELEDGDVDALFDRYFGQSICREDDATTLNDDGKQGLGLAYLGAWPADVSHQSE